MKLSKKDIRRFRLIAGAMCIGSGIVMLVFGKIGGPLLAISLFFLFTPYKENDEI